MSAAHSLPDTSLAIAASARPLARRLARASLAAVPVATGIEKLRLCLLDLFACAFESRELPWVRQARTLAERSTGPASCIAGKRGLALPETVYANSVAGHGLVREDMHAGSVSHLGIVVLPTLLGLAQRTRVSGADFAAAAILGYEVGGRIGRALVTPAFARLFRPTGFTGPIAAAAAGARLLALSEEATASAIVLGANSASGLNEWPHTGADEMFFQAGAASRSAVTAVELAELGARASERGLDGEAGLFAAYRPGQSAPDTELFPGGDAEITHVYFKPAPVCNFAQTPCLAALALAREAGVRAADIRKITVLVTEAALRYPGCDWAGPFARVLQAKMSIHFAVASALLHGSVSERSYERLDDPDLLALARLISVKEDAALTASFPAKQGAIVEVTTEDGRVMAKRLDTVIPATPDEVRARFRENALAALGPDAARALEDDVSRLEHLEDAGRLVSLAAMPAA